MSVVTLVATPDPEGSGSGYSPILCKSCWQHSIKIERRTKVSRLVTYRNMHPNGATGQCGGPTYW